MKAVCGENVEKNRELTQGVENFSYRKYSEQD